MAEPYSSRRLWKHVGIMALVVVLLGAAALPWVKDPHLSRIVGLQSANLRVTASFLPRLRRIA